MKYKVKVTFVSLVLLAFVGAGIAGCQSDSGTTNVALQNRRRLTVPSTGDGEQNGGQNGEQNGGAESENNAGNGDTENNADENNGIGGNDSGSENSDGTRDRNSFEQSFEQGAEFEQETESSIPATTTTLKPAPTFSGKCESISTGTGQHGVPIYTDSETVCTGMYEPTEILFDAYIQCTLRINKLSGQIVEMMTNKFYLENRGEYTEPGKTYEWETRVDTDTRFSDSSAPSCRIFEDISEE